MVRYLSQLHYIGSEYESDCRPCSRSKVYHEDAVNWRLGTLAPEWGIRKWQP